MVGKGKNADHQYSNPQMFSYLIFKFFTPEIDFGLFEIDAPEEKAF